MLATSLGAAFIDQGEFVITFWGDALVLTSLTVSMIVNALATGLIVLRIFKVFRQVRNNTTAEEKSLGMTGGGTLRSIIFVIIESGMTLFAIQLARLIMTVVTMEPSTQAGTDVYKIIVVIHEMLNVIHQPFLLYVLLIMWTRLGYSTYRHPGAGVHRIVFP